jgi:hypothetical protein
MEKGKLFEEQNAVGVAYLASEEILLLSIPLKFVDELCEQLGLDSDLAQAIKQQVKSPVRFDA